VRHPTRRPDRIGAGYRPLRRGAQRGRRASGRPPASAEPGDRRVAGAQARPNGDDRIRGGGCPPA